MKENNDIIIGTLMVVTGLILIVITPLGVIWMLNTLFNLGLIYEFKTWCAALVFTVMLHGNRK